MYVLSCFHVISLNLVVDGAQNLNVLLLLSYRDNLLMLLNLVRDNCLFKIGVFIYSGIFILNFLFSQRRLFLLDCVYRRSIGNSISGIKLVFLKAYTSVLLTNDQMPVVLVSELVFKQIFTDINISSH